MTSPLLHKALIQVSVQSLDKLLSQDADVNEKDSGGQTPLHIAVTIWTDLTFTEKLLYRGASINAGIESGWSPMHVVFSMHPIQETVQLCGLLITAGGRVKDVQKHRTIPTVRWQRHMLNDSDPYKVNIFLQSGYTFTNKSELIHELCHNTCNMCRVNQDSNTNTILSNAVYGSSTKQDEVIVCECIAGIISQLTQPLLLQRLAANIIRESLVPNAWIGVQRLRYIPKFIRSYIIYQ